MKQDETRRISVRTYPDDEAAGLILSTDKRLSQNGFGFMKHA